MEGGLVFFSLLNSSKDSLDMDSKVHHDYNNNDRVTGLPNTTILSFSMRHFMLIVTGEHF